MKNLLVLGTLSFSIAFSLGLVVEKDVTKSAAIGGIATISTLSSAIIFSKKSERELKKSHTEELRSLENQISNQKNLNRKLDQIIDSKNQLKITIEREYDSIVREVNQLREEIKSLNTQRENLQNAIPAVKDKPVKPKPKISAKSEVKPIKKTKLYDCILAGLKNSVDFYDSKNHATFESYLQSLQETAGELWESYRSNQVKISYYDPSIQAVYLIRYYPHYAYMNFQILEIIHNRNFFQNLTDETLEVCLFGAGPCPEIVGLSQLLSEQYQNIKKLIVNVYDIASEEWTLSRNITEKFIIPKYWSGDLSLNSNYLDLCASNSLHSIETTIIKSKIFVFQNCLNEIYNMSTVQANINFLLDKIGSDSVIIIIDLSNYSQNAAIIDRLEKQVSNRHDFEVYRPQIGDIKIKAYSSIPPIIKENLLIGTRKLVPRRNINCFFISLRKTNQKYL